MAELIPIALIGNSPSFAGLKMALPVDTLRGVVNHLDFTDLSVMVKDGAGSVVPVVLAEDTVLGNLGGGISSLPVATLTTEIGTRLMLEDVISTETVYADKTGLLFNSGTGEFEFTIIELNDLLDVSITAPEIGDTIIYDGSTWTNTESVEQLIDIERSGPFSAKNRTLHPVNSTAGPILVSPFASPNPGDYFIITDSRGTANVNNITIRFTQFGQPYHGSAQDDVIRFSLATKKYTYIDGTIGWTSDADEVGTASSIVTYTHTQASAQTVWTINHNLNTFPNVAVVDNTGVQVIADVAYLSANQIQITHAVPVAGEAYLS